MLDGNEEHTLDDVAASLLVKPNEPKTPVTEAKVAKEETNETEESNELNQPVTSEEPAEETVDEDTADQVTEEEEDLDPDEFDIDVTIDGEEKKVKLKDLKANYSGNSAIEKRLQEASEIRNKAQETSQRLHVALQEQAVRLAKLDEIVQKVAEPEINWEELKRTNLPKYLLERDRQREAQERRTVIAQEQSRVKAEQERLEAEARQHYTAEEAKKLLAKIPDLANPEKARETFTKLVATGQAYGYAPEEVSTVIDHRAMLVLQDAMRYRELMNKQSKMEKTTAKPTTLLRPSTTNKGRVQTPARKLQEALTKKARATGKAEDVAATLLVRKK